jgi:hypothetical protein
MLFLPPNMAGMPCGKVATVLRERTVIPRTRPSCFVILYPSREVLVVTQQLSIHIVFDFGKDKDEDGIKKL